jgi:hypothetical protein
MIFFNANLNDNEIEEKLKELDEDHEREIQKRYDRGENVNYQLSSSSTNNDGNGKTLQHHHKKTQYNNNSNKINPKEQSTKEESSVKEIFSQKYADNDYLAEAILIGNKPYFAVSIKRSLLSNSENIIDTADDDNDDISCNNNNNNYFPSIVLQESIPLDETTILKPTESISYLNKPYIFESKDKFYQYVENGKNEADLYSLFKQVKSIWKKYVDADNFHISICAADTIFSYLQDKIGLTHYLFFIGNNGSGKSNNLVIFHYLGYRNMMSTDVTAANIYQYLGNLQEGQGTICEDEADNIDENTDKMRIYKNGYSSGFPVYRTDTTYGRKQYRFHTFCIKAFAAERTPDSIKAKGFNQRIIELYCAPGFPQYDISEVINPAGEEEHQNLLTELLETRKNLLIYKLLHFHDKIPDIKLNIENREKQLFKPIVRIFQNSTEVLDELLPVISNYVSQKRESNADSLHSRIYQLIKRMIKDENSAQLESVKIWDSVINELNGEVIKAQTIQTSDFGPISQKQIIQILKDVFKAKPPRRHGNARSLVFDPIILDKLSRVYDLDVDVKVKRKKSLVVETSSSNNNENGTHGTYGTLSGDGIGLDKHISDSDPNENDGNHPQNIENNPRNSDNSNQMLSNDINKGNHDYQLIENNTLNDNAYSDNASQASHVSQIDDTGGSSSSLYSCYYCDYTSNKEGELIRHSINAHPGKVAQPDESITKLEEVK